MVSTPSVEPRAGWPQDVAIGWHLIDFLIAIHRRLRLRRLRPLTVYLELVPAVALVSLLGVGLISLTWFSLHKYDAFLLRQGPLSLEQYHRLIKGDEGRFYRDVLQRTLLLSALVTVASVAVALPLAYFVIRVRSRGVRTVALGLILVPFLMGETVRAFGWLLLLGRNGALAWITAHLGVGAVTLVGTNTGIVIGMVQVMLPIATLILLPAVRRIEPDLERAAQTLGARPVQTWRLIVIPLARPGLAAAAAAVFTLSTTEFAIPAVLGLGRLPFVANAIQGIYFLSNDIYLGSAFSLVLVVLVTAIVAALVRVARAR
jgi:putative spermidine/putrescine transport system permease protein